MWPDINGFYAMVYGTGGVDLGALTVWQFSNATGMVWSGNPSYTATDFLGFYSKFFGPPTTVNSLVITSGSANVTGFTDTTGFRVGQLVVNLNSIPKDSVITAIGPDNITLSSSATLDDTLLNIYAAPMMPLVVILWFVFLAGASIMQQRYQDAWPFAMSLFIAHFCTLWMRSETGVNATAAQVVSTGLQQGIMVAKSAGDVSASMQLLTGFEEWGSFALTVYGQQFITMARVINCGPIWVQ